MLIFYQIRNDFLQIHWCKSIYPRCTNHHSSMDPNLSNLERMGTKSMINIFANHTKWLLQWINIFKPKNLSLRLHIWRELLLLDPVKCGLKYIFSAKWHPFGQSAFSSIISKLWLRCLAASLHWFISSTALSPSSAHNLSYAVRKYPYTEKNLLNTTLMPNSNIKEYVLHLIDNQN